MFQRSVCSIWLMAVLFWPTGTENATSALLELRPAERVEAAAMGDYLELLEGRGVPLPAQGVRVESLDGSLILADYNGESIFNPASVIKVATSLAALERFGAAYQFQTAFYVDGTVSDTGVLEGDLILSSDGDPEMNSGDLVQLARQVIRTGIRRVDGDFVVSGPFTIGNLHRRERVDRYVTRTLRRIGLRVPDEVTYGPVRGTRVAERLSEPLRDIIFYQNARSDNDIADRLGEALGGPRAVEQYLTTTVGIPANDIRISRTSGLRRNGITPAGTVMVLRHLAYWLQEHSMRPEDVLPIAGLDRGTLRLRFNSRAHRGAVVAKTGTLVRIDEGVSTLAGVLYTRDRGPLLFAIFNTHGPVLQYRKFQDDFIRDLLREYGGKPLASASLRRASN